MEEEKNLGAGGFKGIYSKAFDGDDEIFFRELISFSLCALETFPEEFGKHDPETYRCVRVVLNSTNKTLTFIHWGIGMTKDDLIDNLGTLGSKCFGFWSAFLVAERVVVTTKHDDGEQYVWESQGGRSFKIAKDSSVESLGSTKITLFLKEDQLQYLDPYVIIGLVEKYFKYIDYKITIWVEKPRDKVMAKYVHLSCSNPGRSTWLKKIPFGSDVQTSGEGDARGKKCTKYKKKKKMKQVSFEEKQRQFKTLCEVIAEILGRRVEKVVVSDNVVNNFPCHCSRNPESMGLIMEINSKNATMDQLREMANADKTDKSLTMTIWLLYGLYSVI